MHFHHIRYLFLVYLRHFLNHVIIFFGPFRRPLWPSALGSRLVRLMVAPALQANYRKDLLERKRNRISLVEVSGWKIVKTIFNTLMANQFQR